MEKINKKELGTRETKKVSMNKLGYHFLSDVETCDFKGMIMELSYYLLNEHHTIVEKKCYIIQQVWENDYYRQCTFAKDKLEHWQEMLDNGTAEIISVYHLFNKLNKIIKEKKIKYFMAFNGFFDSSKIDYTFTYFKANATKENLISKLDILDLWDYSKCIFTTLDYIKWAIKNRMFTPTLKIKTSAEALTRYICEKNGFQETHFGIEDLEIEYAILMSSQLKNATRRKNSMELNKKGNWQLVEQARKKFVEQGKL